MFGFGEDLGAGHHHPHIHHLEVITLQNNGNNILADVMHIALHRRNNNFAFRLGGQTCAALFFRFFFFDEGHQVGYRLLHHTRRLHHLRQEHFSLTKKIADDVHTIHQRAFDHMNRTTTFRCHLLARFFSIFNNPLRDAVN